jgi:hypothetical protein
MSENNQSNQNSFLGDMQTVVRGQVESLTRYEIDGDNKGGSIWVSKPNTGKNANNLGNELIKIKMPFAMFDQQKAKVESGELTFPCQMEIFCEVSMGGQNKAVLLALSMKPLVPEPKAPLSEETIDKETGEIHNKDKTAKMGAGLTGLTGQANQQHPQNK